jgi:prolyl 4-hydroxylase
MALIDFQTVVINLFTQKECDSLIALSEKSGYSSSVINGSLKGSNGYVVRNGMNKSRAAIENKPLADALWKRIEKHTPKEIDNNIAIGINERLRFYRYEEGQYFGAHTDGYYQRENGEISFLTLMIFLNDDFTGGETMFLKREKIIAPKTGTALLFTHHQWHAGLKVESGSKYILRTDVMFKQP